MDGRKRSSGLFMFAQVADVIEPAGLQIGVTGCDFGEGGFRQNRTR